MNKNFPNLKLSPPLFYSWDIGIRFELGVNDDPDDIYENGSYVKGVYNRAITLFRTLHLPEDDIYLVAQADDFADGKTFKRKLNIYSKYVKEKSLLLKVHQHTIPYLFPEDDEEGTYKTHRFTLKCKPSDIKYVPLLKAICHQDLGLKPSLFHRVYFININRKTIFHVYDDRGCDLLATSPAAIKDVYTRHNDWILDYDRPEIDKVFK
ncbi:DUF3885 domain-containing protein [Bacillus sp. FJAT-42376]|uniref:DUF3885 domain-containing protein n=1 Tax=Bacillus sp. FJAT-42376 TaxID=2014076 RepID=UPI000F508C8A|nr:DUF3885 domain-containing protein [Bacillus sp. FJAT-42376]AZB44851.1 DUF3885 domain-containing protein [Bacillus sp. FJAT-42376]